MKFGPMKAHRRTILVQIALLVALAGLALTFVLQALDSNINLFFSPIQVVAGEAPHGERIRVGGMVEEGSIERSDRSLQVEFDVTDMAGSTFRVRYTGILPDLFRAGQGVVATGVLTEDRLFEAEEILAKHDEKYMPPEVAWALEAGGKAAGDGS